MKLFRSCLLLVAAVAALPAAAADGADGTQLVAAAVSGRAFEVRDLLAEGADANTKNAGGRPVIVLAGFNGNLRTVRALLAAGADVNAVDANGTSALIAASALGHADVVDLLLATDVLSEGQNLQQAQAVISYDMPWNPQRVVQRKHTG